MLKELRIKNFVLIESLELAFEPGICLLTGETGAGKSIIIDAMEAALGGRVSLDLIRAGAGKATIEATFSLKRFPVELTTLLEEEGVALEIADEITLSRELSPKGSRCRIEGQQVTQTALRRAGQVLVDIISQHEHQALMEPPFHLTLLDTFGGHLAERDAVAEAYAAWNALVAERKALVEGAQARAQQRDFWSFQLQEIQQADLSDPHEDEALQGERLRLANVEQLRHASGSAYEALYAGESGPSLYDQLGRVISSLSGLSHLDPVFAETTGELQNAQYLIREVGGTLRDHADRLDADPGRLEEVEDRLDLLKTLNRKYGPGLDQVMAHASELERQLAEVETADERLAGLEAALVKAEARLIAACAALTTEREAACLKLEAAVERELRELELPNARFKVALNPFTSGLRLTTQPDKVLRAIGAEMAEFLISMNPGEPPRPLAKTASGGEMSRVMLALKTVLADLGGIPTLILDEVDTGISGKAAQAVAEKLAGLGRHFQILCITHLPTVAAMADQHIHLQKHVAEGRTHVEATVLSKTARVSELARLASGDPGAASLRHAEDLLSRAKKFKTALKEPAKAGR